jgi:signal transduction histidine kinase/CheY-like chemotaxis protein/AraC-like DNA-binding protein
MPKFPHPTIGFLTANIHIGAAQPLWRGVLDAAVAGNTNLIGFPGGRLHATENFEAQRNILYRLINTNHLDGLVSWTSALAGTATPEEVVGFHRDYHPLPIVSLASPIDDDPMVSIDGYQGMRDLIAHLVDVHHYRRIALICGPEGHPYALERYHAFLDALKEKGLEPDLNLVSPPCSWEKGAESMRVLLDERGLKPGKDFQAVVAASDLLAIGALGILSERGIRVPGDVAIAGFNDIEEGRLIRPALTSVSLPFYEQGRQSVEALLTKLSGKDVPRQVILDSTLLVRQSCGCPSQSVGLAAAEFAAGDVSDLRLAAIRAQEQIVTQIIRVISNRGIAATWAKQLIDAFRGEIGTANQGQFRVTLDSMLQRGSLDGDETAAWQSAISVLRRELLPALDTPARFRAEDLFGQARVVIGEAIQRAQIARQVQADRQNSALRDIGQALITTFDLDKLTGVLTERLPELGIESCYLALYENPAISMEKARLVLAYTEGRQLALGDKGVPFPSRQLIPPDLLPTHRYSLLVEPLFFQTEPLGFVVFEVGPQDGGIYEELRGHISSALKGALLFRETQDARLVAERADQIKTRLLANVSHELRTPLNIIIGHAQRLQETPSEELKKDLEHIEHSAEHQLRIINDLLDLSRAEINALDLYPARLNSRALIEEAFAALAKDAVSGEVVWELDIPDRMPMIEADPVRVRQILLNLLSNAARFTERGRITLGAAVVPPHLHIWVSDTGSGIPTELVERIYEPFFSREGEGHHPSAQRRGGIGLGLSITHHLVALHQGYLALESEPGRGSTFHVYLPLLSETPQTELAKTPMGSTLWLISNAQTPPQDIVAFAQRRGLAIHPLRLTDDFEGMFVQGFPAVIAYDMRDTISRDWTLIRRLNNHPQLSQTPFVLFHNEEGGASGLTSLVVKPASSQALWEAIRPALPEETAGSVLIVDDDPRARQVAHEAVRKGLPDYSVQLTEDGDQGLAAMFAAPPDLVILDLMMPKMDGFEVLDRMRADERTRRIPVVILSSRQLSLADVKRLEQHTAVILQSKGVLSQDEIIASLNRSLVGADTLPPETSALAKRTIGYLQQNYARSLARWEIAESIGVNEDYLSRVFKRELGITPWDYLNRYRVFRAKEILSSTLDTVAEVGRKVGFSDAAYFSRVFRQVTGISPSGYREKPE